MTNHQIPNPLPENTMLVDDTGAPIAMMNIDQIQADSIALAYDMARNCHDENALDQVSARWLAKVGADAIGYAAAGALRTMTHYILDPTLATVDRLAPSLGYRQMLDDAYRNSITNTAVTPDLVDTSAAAAAGESNAAVWADLPDDPAHPTLDDAPRVLIDCHTIQLHHDVRDEYEDVTVTATYVLDGLTGAQIELGPWSLTASDARELANSLNHLAATIAAVNG